MILPPGAYKKIHCSWDICDYGWIRTWEDYWNDYVIHFIGKDIRLEKADDKHFDAYVKASKQGMVYLALQFINHMEVLEPKAIRDEVKDALKNAQKKYK